MKKTTFFSAACAAMPILLAMDPASAQQSVKVGTLRCDVSEGFGLVITSKRDMRCTYTPNRGRRESYSGSIRRYGLDVGATSRGVLVWSVVAPSSGPAPGALAGEYVGASAEVSAGPGVAANALVGGSGRSYTLQPLSVQGQVGISFAAGVGQMVLVSPQRNRG